MSSIKLRRMSFQWHLWFAWAAAFALLAFSVSAIMHPLVAWTGPQSKSFMPPRASMNAAQLNAIKPVLLRHGIEKASVVKLIPSKQGVVLQLTEDNDSARRYFDLTSFDELPNFDQEHAKWLARYYALGGDESVRIKDISFQTEFDNAYPWVNRLLPVYKVTFDNDESLSTYVYTEINALAGLSNNYKTSVQGIFRALHTWSWLNRFDNARVMIMGFLLICIIAMSVTGFALVLMLKKRKSMTRKAVVHRALAYGLWLPLLMFSASGFYHLLHSAYSDIYRGLKLAEPISLSDMQYAKEVSALPSAPLNQISVVENGGELQYRLSVAPQKFGRGSGGEHAHHEKPKAQRNARFDGQATEKGGIYYSVVSGEKAELTDSDVAIQIAAKRLGLGVEKAMQAKLIKRFGPHYDFRNKRLPVWEVAFDSPLGDRAFIDPATGVLVDRLVDTDRYESYSFSYLHKWNFLTPFTGRFWRDVLVVIVLLLTMLMTGLGVFMKLRK